MNAKVKSFARKASEELVKLEAKINQDIANDAIAIESILLEPFTNENPFQGPTKNKIFFTYSNHYRGNSGTWMSVSSLNHPHTNYEDRGYIKGVATDLDGYMSLKSLLTACEYYNPLYLHEPKFRASKHRDHYSNMVNEIKSNFAAKKKELEEKRVASASEILKQKTDMSLKFYIRNL